MFLLNLACWRLVIVGISIAVSIDLKILLLEVVDIVGVPIKVCVICVYVCKLVYLWMGVIMNGCSITIVSIAPRVLLKLDCLMVWSLRAPQLQSLLI